jgi:hypothetical protein
MTLRETMLRDHPDEAVPVALPRRQGVTLMELTSRTCRWPLWGRERFPERYYCGAAVAAGGVYCPVHCMLAVSPERRR